MRAFFHRLGGGCWRFMVIFSFIVNFILVFVLALVLLLIFDIKQNIAQPLLNGLHSSFVGLDQATIDWTIPVRDDIPVSLQVPINPGTITSQVTQIGGVPVHPIPGETVVRLTRAVPLVLSANISAPSLTVSNARVSLSLPAGTELPVSLDMVVGLDTEIPVELDVRAIIPLDQTQLHDVADNLRLLFEPLVVALDNLPSNFGEAGDLVGAVLAGSPPNLLEPTAYSADPWPGFSRTAGLNYVMTDEPWPPENMPVFTGIVPLGGIPLLDEQIRPWLYEAGGPATINAQARAAMAERSIGRAFFVGGPDADTTAPPSTSETDVETPPVPDAPDVLPPTATPEEPADMGIITPSGGGG